MAVRLTRLQRLACFALAGAAYAAAALSSRERLDAESAFFRTPAEPWTSAARLVSVADVIRRDPFAATPAPNASTSGLQDTVPAPAALAEAVPIPPVLTVPDIAAATQNVADAPHTYVLKATIVGRSSVAYVDDGTSLRVVRAGDVLGGRYVRAIDLRGITFADGSRLSLPERYQVPAEIGRHPGVGRRDALRANARASALPGATPAAAPLASAPPATPGPLPTIKPGAFPLGTAPTSDPAAPTAFPYPYTPH